MKITQSFLNHLFKFTFLFILCIIFTFVGFSIKYNGHLNLTVKQIIFSSSFFFSVAFTIVDIIRFKEIHFELEDDSKEYLQLISFIQTKGRLKSRNETSEIYQVKDLLYIFPTEIKLTKNEKLKTKITISKSLWTKIQDARYIKS